jgi:hypothetical protein
MKLKVLIEAIRNELKTTGLGADSARVSLAFVARSERDGKVECDFVDASDISAPRDGQIHHLELDLSTDELEEPPLAGKQEPASEDPVPKPAIPPAKGRSKKTRIPAKRNDWTGLFSDIGQASELDSPAIYRARPATASV